MATTIKTKSSNVPGKVPDSSSLQPAELAINLKDQKLYSKDTDGVVFELGQKGDFVKLDDEGTQQDIVGGGGLAVEGNVTATNVRTQAVVFQATGGGTHAGAIRFDVGPRALYEFSGVTEQAFELDSNPVLNLKPDGDAFVARGIDAGTWARVNSDKTVPREGLLVNGDISMNASSYSLRFYGSDDTLGNADGYTYAQLSSGSLDFAEAGGRPCRVFM